MPLGFVPDFALRLAAGLAGMLLATPWRVVPPAFFRTHCLVMLGLLVVGALFSAGGAILWACVAAAALTYVASIGWGLGIRRIGAPATAGVLALGASALIAASPDPRAAAARLSSGFLMAATLSAMLLGHHYLTAPAMSIRPLERFLRCMAAALAIRALVALPDLPAWLGLASARGPSDPLGLAMRWGMGLLAPAVATALAWSTVRIRSTQSATGILYIAMTMVLTGELTDMISRTGGMPPMW